jgi:hypothetical protein
MAQANYHQRVCHLGHSALPKKYYKENKYLWFCFKTTVHGLSYQPKGLDESAVRVYYMPSIAEAMLEKAQHRLLVACYR